jgi:hypothetical protein
MQPEQTSNALQQCVVGVHTSSPGAAAAVVLLLGNAFNDVELESSPSLRLPTHAAPTFHQRPLLSSPVKQ